MTTPTSQILAELADREAIKECLYRYSRGMDRLDADMLRTAYWPDCVDDHVGFIGDVEGLIEWSFPIVRSMDQAQHIIGNILMTIHGNTADVESYFYGIQRLNLPDGTKSDVVASGRYVDTLEKRGDEWRILKRLVVTDWFRQYPDSSDWSNGFMGLMIEPGGRYPDDESYKRLKLS